LWVSLPLAACMAVGAALGPTDLVAFASLSELPALVPTSQLFRVASA